MGVVLPKPILSKVVDRSGSNKAAAACCAVNGYRNTMEDAHVLQSGPGARMIFGVFDGHSNDKCSTYVAEHLPRKLNSCQEKLTDAVIEKLCLDLDSQFIEDVGDGGTTATFAIVEPNEKGTLEATVCNIGDSRTLLVRNGQLIFATADHKPTNKEERARIERCGGTVRNNRVDGDLALSRAFGDPVFKRWADTLRNQKVIAVPDITRLQLEPKDILVVACDGVFEGSLDNEEVASFVSNELTKSDDLAVAAARVCDLAIRRGSKDNISCMVVQFKDGIGLLEQFGERSFVPGPPYPRTHESSLLAYQQMASMAQLSVPEALQERYNLLQAYLNGKLNTLPPIMQVAYEMSDEVELSYERDFFGKGPSPGNEKAFFASLM